MQSYDYFLGNYNMDVSAPASCGTTATVSADSGNVLTMTTSDQLVQSNEIAITATTDLDVIIH